MTTLTINLPEAVIDRLDVMARLRQTTRDELLNELAQRQLATDRAARRLRVREMLANPGGHGGRGARYVREARNALATGS
jgi:hypothetical protein